MFLIVTENNASLEIITVKADPQLADALRRAFESIPVGRYFDEWHWISVGPGVGISRQLVEDLVLTSHDLVTRPHR